MKEKNYNIYYVYVKIVSSIDEFDIVFENLARETIQLFLNDISNRDDFFHEGTVKKKNVVECKIRVYKLNQDECKSLHFQVYSFNRTINYDDESIGKLLNQIARLKSFNKALEVASKHLNYLAGGEYFARLYLTLFSYETITRFNKRGELDNAELKNLLSLFLKDLGERSLEIKTTIGMKGICAVDDVVITDPVCKISIHQANESDIPETIIVADNGIGDLDKTNYPHLPDITTILEVNHHKFNIESNNYVNWYIREWDSNDLIDLTIGPLIREANRIIQLLQMFQSKQVLNIKTWKVSYYLKNLSISPIYEKQIKLATHSDTVFSPFTIRKIHHSSLERFFILMREVDFIERIYHYSKDPKNSINHIERPVEIAYTRYLKILSKNIDVDERIHDTIEALEAFFTPEKPKSYKERRKFSKIFIKRIHTLIKIIGVLDPNSTKKILSLGFKLRSDFSHRGRGWEDPTEDQYSLNVLEESVKSTEVDLSDYSVKRTISSILLSYLRICIISRILSGVDDRKFIDLLNTPDGEVQLKSIFSGLSEILSVDPIILLK